jgi:hypothetical protein
MRATVLLAPKVDGALLVTCDSLGQICSGFGSTLSGNRVVLDRSSTQRSISVCPLLIRCLEIEIDEVPLEFGM